MTQKTENRKQKTGFEIVPFRAQHYAGMDWDAVQERSLAVMTQSWLASMIKGAERSMAFTGFHQGRLVGSAGLQVMWPGVAMGWAFFLEPAQAIPMQVCRSIRRGLDMIMESMNLHRVQVAVKADWHKARKLAGVLGFWEEGPMEKYGPDQADYIRVVRLR